MVDSMTDIDLATVHPLAPAGAPGTEIPGAIFRYWNTEDGPRYGAQRCRRSTPGTSGSSAPARTLTPGTSDRPRPGRPRGVAPRHRRPRRLRRRLQTRLTTGSDRATVTVSPGALWHLMI